ncbi:hypothetical protein QGM71_05610 [Virgibacillus sp. C22-A2]|uniref:Uncharacterized protein n=1 Tax=Virgibacillus tibetensis TaxID=3042313 RepID=A0ABU6KEX6_9BACI|nr:hypothetical protein [Virgibacillus sp. C22-A2]
MNNEEQSKKPSEMNPEELPDVRAFEDEFTRRFLQSTEETRPGYYPFLSGTGKYEMDFPSVGIMGEKGYAVKNDTSEGYLIGIDNQNDSESSINVNYDEFKGIKEVDSYLENLEQRLGLKVEFEKYEDDNKVLYFSDYKRSKDISNYVGYVQNKKQNGGIELIYKTKCADTVEECEQSMEAIVDWMKSINFIQISDGSE